MKKTNQTGFAAIEVLLVLVIVGMIGGTGYFVWHAKQNTDETLKNTANSQPAIVKQKQQQGAHILPAGNPAPTKYLLIKEWGVKIPLGSGDAGAYYTIEPSTTESGAKAPYDIAHVYSATADTIIGPKGASCKGEYIAFTMRMPSSDPTWNDAEISGLYSEKKQIGTYSYAVTSKKQYGPSCFNKGTDADGYVPDQVTGDKFGAVVDAFKADFNNIQKD